MSRTGIWNVNKEHDRNAEWLKKLTEKNNYQKQECLTFTKKIVSMQSRKVINWKAPGKDGFQGFWIKKFPSLHEETAFQFNKILNGKEQLSDWLTYGRTVLCQKDQAKGDAEDNYRPTSCLPLIWKLLTGNISEYFIVF